MKQYSKRTAILHWLIFVLVIAAFYFGHQLEESKDGAQKLSLYPLHFLIGDLVLLLTLVEGLKPGEIARKIGVSADVARTRKSRALKRILDVSTTRHGIRGRPLTVGR